MFHSRLRLPDDPKSWTSIAAPLEPIFYESLGSTFWPSTITDSCPNMFRTDFEGMCFTHFTLPIFGIFFLNVKILQQLPSNPMHVIDNKIFLLWSCELTLKGKQLRYCAGRWNTISPNLAVPSVQLSRMSPQRSMESREERVWNGCGFVKILRTITWKLTGSSRRRSPPNHSQDGLSFAGSCNLVIIRLPNKSDKRCRVLFICIIMHNSSSSSSSSSSSFPPFYTKTNKKPRRLRFYCPRIAEVHRANEQDVLEALESSSLKAGYAGWAIAVSKSSLYLWAFSCHWHHFVKVIRFRSRCLKLRVVTSWPVHSLCHRWKRSDRSFFTRVWMERRKRKRSSIICMVSCMVLMINFKLFWYQFVWLRTGVLVEDFVSL